MIPPVSLALKAGTQSARAGAQASMIHIARLEVARLEATILRITDSVRIRRILGRIAGHEKNTGRLFMELRLKCCRLALDPVRPSRHVPAWPTLFSRIPHAHADVFSGSIGLHSDGRGPRRRARCAHAWPARAGCQSVRNEFRADIRAAL